MNNKYSDLWLITLFPLVGGIKYYLCLNNANCHNGLEVLITSFGFMILLGLIKIYYINQEKKQIYEQGCL